MWSSILKDSSTASPLRAAKGEEFPLTLGSNQFIPGFEEQIAGHAIGEDFDVNVSFPENYHVDELKGKPAVFKCKIHQIKAVERPSWTTSSPRMSASLRPWRP